MLTFKSEEYKQEWLEIQDLESKGQTQTAKTAIEKLLKKADNDNVPVQIIKAIIHREKYNLMVEDNGLQQSIQRLEAEILKSEFPVKPILQSITAELLQSYIQQNSYKFRGRTSVTITSPDISTWSLDQLVARVRNLYWASLSDDRIKKVAIGQIEALTVLNGDAAEADKMIPTLFDFLGTRALQHFQNENSYLTEPAYRFEIEDKNAFAKAKTFINTKFETKDSSSQKLATLQLFQELLRFHSDDKDETVMAEYDVQRIDFVNNNCNREDVKSLYINALERLAADYAKTELKDYFTYKQAQHYYDEGTAYNPVTDADKKILWKKAFEICQKIPVKDKNKGSIYARVLEKNIQRKELSLKTEIAYLPNQANLMRVDYRNVTDVFFRIIPLQDHQLKAYKAVSDDGTDGRNIEQKQFDYLSKQQFSRAFGGKLLQDGDFRTHSTEVKIDALAFGTYVVMAANNQDFKDLSTASAAMFTVTNLSAYTNRNEKNLDYLMVTHRSTGEPQKGVIAELFYDRVIQNPDYSQTVRHEKIGNAISNEQGIVAPNVVETIQNYQVRLVQGQDTFIVDSYLNNMTYPNNAAPEAHESVLFFMDRGIYRPGQLVYYKGIVLNYDKKGVPSVSLNARKNIEVTFFDANHQKITTATNDINEFGSFTGTFTAPTSGLNGQMSIEAIGNSTYFRVEEYKRPKFLASFKPMEGTYRVNDKVTVKGEARAYAGNALDGVRVKYRVSRQTTYNYDNFYWKYMPYQSPMEIANGELMTDEKGEFSIPFMAIPDPKSSPKSRPTFSYTINVDVTDINGETHAAETVVVVAYEALKVNIDISKNMQLDSMKKIVINTTNMAGINEAVSGTLRIIPLRSPRQIYIKRYWETPDRPLFSKKEFTETFPNIPFEKEDEMEQWEQKTELLNTSHNTKTPFDASFIKWEAGAYCVIFTTQDKYGTKVEDKQYFTVEDKMDKINAVNETFFSSMDKDRYQPNDIAVLTLGTSEIDGINVLLVIQKKGIETTKKWIKVLGKTTFSMPISPLDKGDYEVRLYTVKSNRFVTAQHTVSVPYSEKELIMETSTFRDKLQPGQQEEWILKIKGNKKEAVMAELVATLYDKSLDEFAPYDWSNTRNLLQIPYYNPNDFYPHGFGEQNSINSTENYDHDSNNGLESSSRNLNWFSLLDYTNNNNWGGYPQSVRMAKSSAQVEVADMSENSVVAAVPTSAVTKFSSPVIAKDGETKTQSSQGSKPTKPIQIRKNLNETVFFMPQLLTDTAGNIVLKFKMNEALTRWKFLAFAHTKDMATAVMEREIVTQKELMVQPNPPRFVREGDKIQFSTKIANISNKNIVGNVKLELFDPFTNQSLDAAFANANNAQGFTVLASKSTVANWTLQIPENGLGALQYRIVATSADFNDGEENALPILTNRMLITETKPMTVRPRETKNFSFKSFAENTSPTLKSHKMTLEYTSNPAWYAVQALPYLMEYPHDCSEQVFSRYFANTLASYVANSQPKIKAVFDKWRELPESMMSPLQKNEDLKTAINAETPWVLEGQNEAQQKKDIALLFDINRMSNEQAEAIKKLMSRQSATGGFPWFPGAQDDWYITQHILEGLGHLKQLGIVQTPDLQQLTANAVRFCDIQIVKQYDYLLKYEKKIRLDNDHLDWMVIHYLNTRSYFKEIPIDEKLKKAHTYYVKQIEKYWLDKGFYAQAMIAQILQRNEKQDAAIGILRSLKENAMRSDELGMSWKNTRGYNWYEAPVEMHSKIIEAFQEITPNDLQNIDEMKLWLLKNKETTHWKTTKATASATYALLLSGKNWLLDESTPTITVGNKAIDANKLNKEPGTGYFKTTWAANEIDKSFANINVTNNGEVANWGSMYWQYFEQLDNIKTFEDTPLKLKKKLFKVENGDRGPRLTALSDNVTIKVGDRIKVRIEMKVDRAMDYVHLKDTRASGFEPASTLSQYKYQDGLGYYESPKDASSNFFISNLPKGSYIFEYEVIANNKGDFSNGVTTLQSMYAPQYTSHSEGGRVVIE